MSDSINKFKLVFLATERAKEITTGSYSFIKKENKKPIIAALEEIEKGYVAEEDLLENIYKRFIMAERYTNQNLIISRDSIHNLNKYEFIAEESPVEEKENFKEAVIESDF